MMSFFEFQTVNLESEVRPLHWPSLALTNSWRRTAVALLRSLEAKDSDYPLPTRSSVFAAVAQVNRYA